MKTTILLLLTAVLFAAVPTATAQGPTLGQLQETFQKQSKRISDELKVKTLGSGDRYLERLATIQTGYQVAGQFDPMQAVKKESDRWKKELKLEPADVVAQPAELKAVQQQFIESLRTLEVESARKRLNLASQYNKLLLVQRESLTKAGKVEEATVADREIKALKVNPAVAKAKQIVDQSAARTAAAAATTATADPAAAASRSFREGDEVRLQKRYRELWDALGKQDPKTTMTLIDPLHLKKVGEASLKPHIGIMQGIVATAKGFGVTLSKTEVTLDASKTSATLIPVLKNPFTGESNGDPSFWSLVEGDWYLDVTKQAKAAPAAPPQAGDPRIPPNLDPKQIEEIRRRLQQFQK